MSAPSKITAIRHAVSALYGAADDGADTRRYADALQGAGAALDELIEAAEILAELAADASTEGCFADGIGDELDALEAVQAALARVKGGAA